MNGIVDVVIPTYRPQERLLHILECLEAQTVRPRCVHLINTEQSGLDTLLEGSLRTQEETETGISGKECAAAPVSAERFMQDDDTGEIDRHNSVRRQTPRSSAEEALLIRYPFLEITHIRRDEFDHGGTRNLGFRLCKGADYVLTMTQDALPADRTLIERLLEAMCPKGKDLCPAQNEPSGRPEGPTAPGKLIGPGESAAPGEPGVPEGSTTPGGPTEPEDMTAPGELIGPGESAAPGEPGVPEGSITLGGPTAPEKSSGKEEDASRGGDRARIDDEFSGDGAIAVAYARQLPNDDAPVEERLSRYFNYPETSRIKSESDREKLGIKTYYCSNVCALYRMDIWHSLGGFPEHAIFNEDMIYASGALKAGYRICYAAAAQVYHSHRYTARQQFHRNFDLGVSQAQNPQVFGGLSSEGEGISYVKAVVRRMLAEGAALQVPGFAVRCAARLIGYRLGKSYERLPRAWVVRFSSNRGYWGQNHPPCKETLPPG